MSPDSGLDPEVTPFWTGGTGEPVVLLHGVNVSWRVWEPVLPLLEAHGTIFAPTLAGHRGGPVLPEGPAGITELADAMEAELDRQGLSTAHLVGNSLGGWLALELASRGRARSVVAFSPAGAWDRPRDKKRLIRLFRMAARAMERPRLQRLLMRPGFRKLALRQVCAHPERIPTDDVPGMIADMLGCTFLPSLLDSVTAADHLAPFTIPTGTTVRIVWPIKDRTIPWKHYGVPMVALVPGAEVVRATGVGHVPMLDDPEMVVRQVVEVVQEATASAAERPRKDNLNE